MKNSNKFRLAIFASGTGTNAEAIMVHFENHPLVDVVLLLSNNPHAGALDRARTRHVPSKVFARTQFREGDTVLEWLQHAGVTHVVLAGFLWLVPQNILKAFPDKVINIHPSLLPKYGGKGMYGDKVHEAALLSKDNETGITIHVVNERFDEGRILFQAKCEIDRDDDVSTIAKKVHALEHAHFPKVIEGWILRQLKTP